MRAVMLAAGVGQRLGDLTADVPKPLIPLQGVPLVLHTLGTLETVGVDETVVVTGYRGAQVEEYLADVSRPRLTFATNHNYRRGASYSLAAARELCGDEPFLLVMCDHVLSVDLIARLVRAGRESPPGRTLVAADRGGSFPPDYVDEATRIDIGEDGSVMAIGKHLALWSALDCGAFWCSPAIWGALDASPEDCDLSTIFRTAIRRNEFYAADVSGCMWYDIDTEADLAEASRLLERGPGNTRELAEASE